MTWNTNDPLVGETVYIETGYGDDEIATVLAVSTKSTMIRVEASDGEIMVGNQWEPHS